MVLVEGQGGLGRAGQLVHGTTTIRKKAIEQRLKLRFGGIGIAVVVVVVA